MHPMIKLVSVEGVEVALDAPEITVGRGLHNMIQLDDPRASRSHAHLLRRGRTYIVEDLHSSNGTWVNRVRIETPVELTNGDELIFGDSVFTFVAEPVCDEAVSETAAALVAEEWQTLHFAPLWTLRAVIDAYGRAAASALDALALELHSAPCYTNLLMREVLMALALDTPGIATAFDPDERSTAEGLGDTADIIDDRLPADQARDFKLGLLYIGYQAARAAQGSAGGGLNDAGRTALSAVAGLLRLEL
jgi:pSer/pThr/pTyr-binding forkhead associated (FHA) protein